MLVKKASGRRLNLPPHVFITRKSIIVLSLVNKVDKLCGMGFPRHTASGLLPQTSSRKYAVDERIFVRLSVIRNAAVSSGEQRLEIVASLFVARTADNPSADQAKRLVSPPGGRHTQASLSVPL